MNPRLLVEQLESRALMAGLSVADVTTREGPASLGALDPTGAAAVSLDGPRSIAFNDIPSHPHYRDLFVANAFNHSVLRFDWETQTYQTFVAPNSGGLGETFATAFGPDGKLYVTALNQDTVLQYDGTDGHFLGIYVASGSGGLDDASGITFGSDGTLFVASSKSGQILRYQGPNGQQPGNFLGVFANTGVGSVPDEMTFGPDGNLYVACPQFDTPLPCDGVVNRYQGLSGASPGQFIDTFIPTGRGGQTVARSPVFDSQGHLYVADAELNEILRYQGPNEPNPGAFIDSYVTSGQGSLNTPIGLAIGPNGNLFVGDRDYDKIVEFAPTQQARFLVSLDAAIANEVSVNYATANGTATAGGDYVQTFGTLVFAPGETTKTVIVPTLDDRAGESTETFNLILTNAVNTTITESQGIGTILDNETKFYVVDATSSGPLTYEYASGGTSEEITYQRSTNTTPRGVATTAAGTKVWVVDNNKTVYVYDHSGWQLGSWNPGGLNNFAQVEGIATNGTDVWIVDNKADRVYRYANTASALSGNVNATSSFSLNSGNKNPKDIVTDGTYIWVVDDGTSTDKVFRYDLNGSNFKSWTIDTANKLPTGLTIDPTGSSQSIWIVDSGTDKVYEYTNARSRTSGGQLAAANPFALAAGNTNPQGIADPPPPAMIASNALVSTAEKRNVKTLSSSNSFIAQVDSIFENWNEDSIFSQTKKRLAGRR